MSDFRDALDNEARRVRSDPVALETIMDLAARRHRSKRVATGVLALALAAGGIGVTYAAFDPGRTARPAGRPLPGPSTSFTPGPLGFIRGLELSNESSTQGAAEFAAALMVGEGIIPPDVLATGGDSLEVTTIHCHPTREAEAVWLRDRFFPGAELRPRIDPNSILVRIGDDFVRGNRATFELFMVARSFLTLRVEGSGAEALLSPEAADRIEAEESGVSLYAYLRGGTFQIQGLYPRGDGTAWVTVAILAPEGSESALASERLTLGEAPVDTPRVLDVELTQPPDPMFEQIRIFVRQFLRARRDASGAGTFLGENAREAYAANEDGLDLLGYAETAERTQIVRLDKLSPELTLVRVRFSSTDGSVEEDLTVERLGQTMFVIADAERVRPN